MSKHFDVTAVTFYFDSACPWTWRTARWLVAATGRRGIPLSYRAFDLTDGAPLDELPDEYRPAAAGSRCLLRLAEAAHADGRDTLTGTVYAAYGAAVFDGGADPSPELAERCLAEAGAATYADVLHDTALDRPVALAREQAQEFSGEDAGSPVTVVTTPRGERGFFGPVVAPTPTGAEADRLWDALVGAASVPQFFELRARRTAKP
ncbi:thioredoxin-like reductase [Streptomyces chrestomyceticus JCM 4735]|uniref:Thioredoxin-like reductase n=1 Tax=Streptomyces chrestomyceticus JCM 4735 TaxID=1306181 RepID=A0A7U9KZD8_9ACTN|nr:DsbA family protein [Streptomyces chrestomyceticus]GCD38194.1 thioredoxin-like reductase [Streptomyces chrestomyceticus JCM 4735]